jgi:hypothetical protein
LDPTLPGFGPFGTCGAHAFDRKSAAFVRIAHLVDVRKRYPLLRYGRSYARPLSNFGSAFADSDAGELIAWSRILDDEEALCIINGNGGAVRGGDVVVDADLNADDAAGRASGASAPSFVVVANSAQAAHEAAHPGIAYNGSHPIGQRVAVQSRDGTRCVAIRDIGPSEVLVLVNRP